MVSHTSRFGQRLAALVAGSLLALLAPALSHGAPAPRTLTLVTPGTPLQNMNFVGSSPDGKRVYFRTTEALLPADTDTSADIYEHHAGVTRLISGGTGAFAADFEMLSGDGTRAYFSTAEQLDPADTDATADVYERRVDGTLRLMTAGTQQSFDLAVNHDGSRFFFATEEPLSAGDTDVFADFYERREDGTVQLLTPGTPTDHVGLSGISDDGTRFRFFTDDGLLPLDTDDARDVYERHANGSLRMISTGGADVDTEAVAASADGTRVYFETREAIPGTGDFDEGLDTYERSLDGNLRLVTMPNSAEFDSENIAHVSTDGSRVTFTTMRSGNPADTDSIRDVYQRTDSSLRLISAGNDNFNAEFAGASDDGTAVYFMTDEAVAGSGDADAEADVYLRAPGGTVSLVTAGTQNIEVVVHAVTADGARLFFSSEEAIAMDDNDGVRDVYEGTASDPPRLISTGDDTPAQQPTLFGAAARDGSRVLFQTSEALVGTGDFDSRRDIYERAWTVPTFDAPPAITGTPQPGQTLSCSTQVTGDGMTVSLAWQRDGQTIPAATGASYTVATGDAGAAITCAATATNVIGTATSASAPANVPAPPVLLQDPPPSIPAAPPTPASIPPVPGPPVSGPQAPDTLGPAVALTAATCPRKAKSKKACDRFRKTRAAWRTLRFSADDPAGVASVKVGVVRQSGKRCFALRGKRFASQNCSKARAQTQTVKPRSGKYSLKLPGLKTGKHTVRIVATDGAGNQTTFTTTVSIRK